MHHFTLDGHGGYRTRYDDIGLIYELLDEVPAALGLRPVMPPMVLPYYNGVAADDCGISAFVFLNGGHMTLHTFSVRECFFADLLAPESFAPERAQQLCTMNLPVADSSRAMLARAVGADLPQVHPAADFGPHLMIDVDGYCGPRSLDDLFTLFDALPQRIGMTPIMRPYCLRSQRPDGTAVTSAMTMIAESHVAIHVFEAERKAYFDIFSCSFFELEPVAAELKSCLPGARHDVQLVVRGRRYREIWTEREHENARSRLWLSSRLEPQPPPTA